MRSVIVATLVLILPPVVPTQSPAPVTLEVASVKPDPTPSRGAPRALGEITLPIVRILPGGRLESYGHTLRNLIAWAYDMNTLYQKIDGKQEVLESEFRISATATSSSLTPAEAKVLIRLLLEERFQLHVRLQPRDIDAYALVPARDGGRPGPGLRTFTGDCDARAANSPARFDSPDYEQQARCGWVAINDRQRAIGVSMQAVAERLLPAMGTPVSDRTGWPGLFTFDVTGTTREMPGMQLLLRGVARPPGATGATDAPPLLDVFRSELGLKLVKERTTINDLVIERAEPLIEN